MVQVDICRSCFILFPSLHEQSTDGIIKENKAQQDIPPALWFREAPHRMLTVPSEKPLPINSQPQVIMACYMPYLNTCGTLCCIIW